MLQVLIQNSQTCNMMAHSLPIYLSTLQTQTNTHYKHKQIHIININITQITHYRQTHTYITNTDTTNTNTHIPQTLNTHTLQTHACC